MECIIAMINGNSRPPSADAADGSCDSLSDISRAKLVLKHWGEERWLIPEGSAFGFKLIVVRAGHRTSLQYHRRKEEAHLVLSGHGRLIFAGTSASEVTAHELVPGQTAHIRAGVRHRVEALTDLILVEVSTPELDDVVRIEDDAGRGNGRIQSEHLGD
jgi:mannose-6-phosphate isomerase-like protein (cupin superfamily)